MQKMSGKHKRELAEQREFVFVRHENVLICLAQVLLLIMDTAHYKQYSLEKSKRDKEFLAFLIQFDIVI